MDNLAHTLVGIALAETGLKRRTRYATATLVIGANLPDIDVLALLFGVGLSFRRGWTHGVLAIVLLPFLLTLLMLAWARWGPRASDPERAPRLIPLQIFILAWVGVLSHPFLDWLNNYGLRWLMPFDGRWFYGDALFIVDPWLWLWLMLGIGVAIGRRSRRPAPGILALAAASLYIAVMLASAWIGRGLVERGLREAGVQPEEVMVGPVAVNPNRKQVVVREGDRYLTGRLDWFPRPRLVIDEGALASNRLHPAALRAAQSREARHFLAWSRFPFFLITATERGYSVLLDDARYSDGTSPSWAAVRIELPSLAPAPGGGRRPANRATEPLRES